VSLRHANRTFGAHTVLHEVDIEIEPGEVVALLGSSGSGKSTLRRLVAGLDRPTDGRIELDGKSRQRDRPTLCDDLSGTSPAAVAIPRGDELGVPRRGGASPPACHR
jgi:ABC-type multidrug transport system ATPase subunit